MWSAVNWIWRLPYIFNKTLAGIRQLHLFSYSVHCEYGCKQLFQPLIDSIEIFTTQCNWSSCIIHGEKSRYCCTWKTSWFIHLNSTFSDCIFIRKRHCTSIQLIYSNSKPQTLWIVTVGFKLFWLWIRCNNLFTTLLVGGKPQLQIVGTWSGLYIISEAHVSKWMASN